MSCGTSHRANAAEEKEIDANAAYTKWHHRGTNCGAAFCRRGAGAIGASQ